MGLKKNNPGCACCGRVLVWDMGDPSLNNYTVPGNDTETFFGDFTQFKEAIDDGVLPLRHEAEDGEEYSAVDFATGSVFPDSNFWGVHGETETEFNDEVETCYGRARIQPAGNSGSDGEIHWVTYIRKTQGEEVVSFVEFDLPDGYSVVEDQGEYCITGIGEDTCPVDFDTESRFNPETDGVDLDYWSGDISDYRLIVWRMPLANSQRVLAYDIGCGVEFPGSFCDIFNFENLYVFGGEPSWLAEILTGRWSGRLVIVTSGAYCIEINEDEEDDLFGHDQGIGFGLGGNSSFFTRDYSFESGIETTPVVRVMEPDPEEEDFADPYGDYQLRTATVLECDLTLATVDDNGEPVYTVTDDAIYLDGLITDPCPDQLELPEGSGEIVPQEFATTDMRWIEYCDARTTVDDFDRPAPGFHTIQDTPTACGMRATVAKPDGGTVDYVFVNDSFLCPDTRRSGGVNTSEVLTTEFDENRMRFIKNLYNVAVRRPQA